MTAMESVDRGTPAGDLADKIEARTAVVSVIGLGYVGLPLALAVTRSGFRVLGFDVDSRKTAAIGAGRSYIRHVPAKEIKGRVDGGMLEATADPGRLGEADVILICVPTPLADNHEPDLSFVMATADLIAARLRAGQLVILESTTYPGTTEDVVRPALEDRGLRLGEDFFLAYSPEREDPGNPEFDTASIPKVVGGCEPVSGQLAELFYGEALGSTIAVSDARAAEATKLTENVFRAVNIALVNELKLIYERLGVDIWEVLDAAETKPFGFMRFNPGPGWGGHCIPIDPFYLSWQARRHGRDSEFIRLAGRINIEMPGQVVQKVHQAVDRPDDLDGVGVLILGLAYKKDVADPRESPAFDVISRLLAAGAEVSYHDPLIPSMPRMRSWEHLPRLDSVELDANSLSAADVVVVVTDHSEVDYGLVARHASRIVDTRGTLPAGTPNLIRA